MLQLNSLNNPIINSKQNPKHFLSLFIINFLIENNKRGNHLFISLTFFYLKLELKLKSLVYIWESYSGEKKRWKKRKTISLNS
jgi:hypothetical protein